MITFMPIDQALFNSGAVVQITNDPSPVETLSDVRRNPSASEWVAYEITCFGRQLDDPLENDRRQFVCGPILVLPVANRRNVVPHIG